MRGTALATTAGRFRWQAALGCLVALFALPGNGGTARAVGPSGNGLIPGRPVAVSVTRYVGLPPTLQPGTVVVAQVHQVRHLARLLDALPRLSPTVSFACPNARAGWYDLAQFSYADGTELSVKIGMVCPFVARGHGEVVGANQRFLAIVRLMRKLFG